MKRFLSLFVYILAVAGCMTIHSPSKSRLFAVQGSELTQAFPETDRLRYFLALKVKKPQDKVIYLDIRYENPCDRRHPIMATATLPPKETRLLLESPALGCVKDHRYYRVKVTAYDSAGKSRRIDRITQLVYATLNSKTLSENLRH